MSTNMTLQHWFEKIALEHHQIHVKDMGFIVIISKEKDVKRINSYNKDLECSLIVNEVPYKLVHVLTIDKPCYSCTEW